MHPHMQRHAREVTEMVRIRAETKSRQPRITGAVQQPSGPTVRGIHPTPLPETRLTKRAVTAPPMRGHPIPRAAYSIPEFCEAFGIAIRTYFNLRDEGKGPREMRLGRRVLISAESALAWTREREVATTEHTNP